MSFLARRVFDEAFPEDLFVQALKEEAIIKLFRAERPAEAIRMQQVFLLGDSESEALALARQQLTDVILLDEARAVRCAREMGLPVLRTVGLLLQAKAQGHLASVQPALDQRRASGFRLSQSVYQAALRHASESP
jgi:predicted nucleic acid-binding protein